MSDKSNSTLQTLRLEELDHEGRSFGQSEDVEITNNFERSRDESSTHAECYIGSARGIRMAPLSAKSRSHTSPDKKIGHSNMVFSLVLFGTFAAFALIYDILETKSYALMFLHKQTLNSYLDFGYEGMNLLMTLSFVHLLIYETPFLEFLKDLRRREEERNNKTLVTKQMVKATTFAMMLSSVFCAIIATLDPGGGWAGVMSWSIDILVVNYHSLNLARGLLCWTPSALGNYNDLKPIYATNRTTITMAFGMTNMILEFCSHLFRFIIQDAILSNTFSFYFEIRESARICTEVVETIYGAETQYHEIVSIRKLDKKYKEALERNIRVMIVQNLFLFTYLLEEALESETYVLLNVALAINAVKAIGFYWLSCKINEHGETVTLCAKRLHRTFGDLIINDKKVLLKVLVDEIKSNPISVGKGGFAINETFNIGMISSVFTFFCLLATARNKDK